MPGSILRKIKGVLQEHRSTVN